MFFSVNGNAIYPLLCGFTIATFLAATTGSIIAHYKKSKKLENIISGLYDAGNAFLGFTILCCAFRYWCEPYIKIVITHLTPMLCITMVISSICIDVILRTSLVESCKLITNEFWILAFFAVAITIKIEDSLTNEWWYIVSFLVIGINAIVQTFMPKQGKRV